MERERRMESPSSSMSVDIGWFVLAVTPYHPSTISNDNQYQTNALTNTLRGYGVPYGCKAWRPGAFVQHGVFRLQRLGLGLAGETTCDGVGASAACDGKLLMSMSDKYCVATPESMRDCGPERRYRKIVLNAELC
jgi:hypothetical protein